MTDEQKVQQDVEELQEVKAAYEEVLRRRRAELANAENVTNLNPNQNNPVQRLDSNSNSEYKL